MRHLSKIDEQKALLKAYESVNKHLYAFLFQHLKQFFGEFLVACVLATVPISIAGIWVLLLSNETSNTTLTAQDMAQVSKVVVQLTGLQLLMFGIVLAYFAYIT